MQRLIASGLDVSSQMPFHAPAAFLLASSRVYEERAVQCRMVMQKWTAVLLLCILASAPACSSLTSSKRDLLQSKAPTDRCPIATASQTQVNMPCSNFSQHAPSSFCFYLL